MVKITSHAPLSHVFLTKAGPKSLPAGATDTFELADPNDPIVARLKAAGEITVETAGVASPAAASAATPAAPAAPHPSK